MPRNMIVAALLVGLPVLSQMPSSAVADEATESEEIAEITVNARRVAN